MSAWDRFKKGSTQRQIWVEEGRKRAGEHSLEWLKSALKNAKLMDDGHEVKVLGMAVHFKEQLDKGPRICLDHKI